MRLPSAAAATHRRQVTPAPLIAEAVEHGPQELHERGLTGLVRTVDHGQTVGDACDLQPVPDAKAVDPHLMKLHARVSSPASRSPPRSVASCRTRAFEWASAI